MAIGVAQPVHSRRYGPSVEMEDDGYGENRHMIDDLGSSVAIPPPGAMEGRLTPERPRRTLFSAIDDRAVGHPSLEDLSPASNAQIWKNTQNRPHSSAKIESPSPTQNETSAGLGRSRSFLDAYSRSDSRPWLDDNFATDTQNAPTSLTRRPTVTEEVDEEAPREPRIRTVLSTSNDFSDMQYSEGGGVPIVSATAAALAKLTNEEPIVAPVEKDRKKKKKVLNENGEPVVRRKKREKDGTTRERKDPTRRRKRVPVDRGTASQFAGEEPVGEWMDETAPTTYLDTMRGSDAGVHDNAATSSMLMPANEILSKENPSRPEMQESVKLTTNPFNAMQSEKQTILSSPTPPEASFAAAKHRSEQAQSGSATRAAPVPPISSIQNNPFSDPADIAIMSPAVQASIHGSPSIQSFVTEATNESRAAPIAERWRKGQLDPDAMSLVSTSTYNATRKSQSVINAEVYDGADSNRFHVFNQNASRLAINVYILYHGLFVMIRRLWRWEQPWLTGGVAAFYLVVWWRGDLLAIFFLLTFLYIATFRWLHLPAEETFESDDSQSTTSRSAPGLRRKLSNRSVMRRTHRLDLIATQPLTVASHTMLQQIGDQILVHTHGMADLHERMKNLAMWRSPMVTLRYLGWLLLIMILSAQVTTWMMVKLPGAMVFLTVFFLAPMVEYGYWSKIWDFFNDTPSAGDHDKHKFTSSSRTMLDSVLSGVPTDEEYLYQARAKARWEREREQRRRGEYSAMEPNRIVEELSNEPRARRRREPRTARPSRRVLQRWQDAPDRPEQPRAEAQTVRQAPVADTSGLFTETISTAAETEAIKPDQPKSLEPDLETSGPRPQRSSRRGYVLPDPSSTANVSQQRGVQHKLHLDDGKTSVSELQQPVLQEEQPGQTLSDESHVDQYSAAHSGYTEVNTNQHVSTPPVLPPTPVRVSDDPIGISSPSMLAPPVTEAQPIQLAPAASPVLARALNDSAGESKTQDAPWSVNRSYSTAADLPQPYTNQTGILQTLHSNVSDAVMPTLPRAQSMNLAAESLAPPSNISHGPESAPLPNTARHNTEAQHATQPTSLQADQPESNWEDVESVASEYGNDDGMDSAGDGPEDHQLAQPTVAERALSALGFDMTPNVKDEKSTAPELSPTPPLRNAKSKARWNVEPAPPLFEVAQSDVPSTSRMTSPAPPISMNGLGTLSATAPSSVEYLPNREPSGSVAEPRQNHTDSAQEYEQRQDSTSLYTSPTMESVPLSPTVSQPMLSSPMPIGSDSVRTMPIGSTIGSAQVAPAPVSVSASPSKVATTPHSPQRSRPMFVSAQSDTLQEQLERRRRAKIQQRETLERTIHRQVSQASLSMSQDGTAMSPSVSIEAINAQNPDLRASPARSPTRQPVGQQREIRWFDDATEANCMYSTLTPVYLAVHRKRVGHLLVLPTRVVFQLTHSTIKPLRTPHGMTESEFAKLTKEVDGRTFYPSISPRSIRDMVRAEMQKEAKTPFEAYSVMASVIPEPNRIMFEADIRHISTVKRTRKNTPVMDDCVEGLEITLDDQPKGLTLPAVIARDEAFQQILALDPTKWPA
ncbi:hypothetical protein MYAM1_001328 [Malassezia yamatoensis]|uniref:Uncharacterized protein n=1 Tax=Malassezia yamatoensis TaxID=253288 RepID=A0AAJ5YQA5_9BASI|nr:hypothetical protein MYAM1_001328 [Malassezia yamatoensis]